MDNPVNEGKGSAIRNGVLHSHGDIVLYTDCDLAYGVEQIKDMISFHIKNDCDITIGSRSIHSDGYAGYSWLRKLASKAYLKLIVFYSRCKQTDTQTGLKCLNGDTARTVFLKCTVNRFAFDLEMLMIAQKLGASVAEFPVKVLYSDKELNRKSSVHLIKDTLCMLRDIRNIKKRIKTI